jgi:hypothetical protein
MSDFPGRWQCGSCTLFNDDYLDECEVCCAPKGLAPIEGSGGASDIPDGVVLNWTEVRRLARAEEKVLYEVSLFDRTRGSENIFAATQQLRVGAASNHRRMRNNYCLLMSPICSLVSALLARVGGRSEVR